MYSVIIMYSYIKGIITEINSNNITIENNDIGYEVITANPYQFKLNNIYKIYIYEHIREDERILYGFKEKNTKELFLKLINVKGLGCKMALPMLATEELQDIINAIETENIEYLKKFPKIGEKVAQQIILDLKGKLNLKVEDSCKELIETLKVLGYKNQDINGIIKRVDKEKPLEEQIKDSLKLLLK